MKKKLNIVFVLMALALLGIILFQIYWTANAYAVNKEKFDTNANSAMQKAMDECKKDYFDSIRRVLVKRLSPPEMVIKVDTLPQPPIGIKESYDILFLHKDILPPEPYTLSKSTLDLYGKKVNQNPTLPESITETAFYVPELMRKITSVLSSIDLGANLFTMADIRNNSAHFRNMSFKGKSMLAFALKYKSHDSLMKQPPKYYKHLRDSILKDFIKSNDNTRAKKADMVLFDLKKNAKPTQKQLLNLKTKASAPITQSPKPKTSHFKLSGVYEAPLNYRAADSLKLYKYFKSELEKIHINAPYQLVISRKNTAPSPTNMHYSETDEYSYKYHGFKVFGIGVEELFIRAKFLNPQFNVLRNMLATLMLSAILILFTIFCFNYIRITFIQQKRLADLKDDFINNMTHELKTPIATITVAIEGMQNFNALNDPEKTERYLQTSRNELSRLNDLVTKVLDIAAFENKGVELTKEKINVNAMINEVIASEKAKSTKNININYVNDNEVSAIYADKIHFRNVLLNLVDNAIKYSNEAVHIVIGCHKSGDNAIISVKDNGIGIPASHVNLVFEKFHRVPTGNVHNVKGTGLGLSYVKYIVEAHGGTINVKSEIGKGTEFIVCIPLSNG